MRKWIAVVLALLLCGCAPEEHPSATTVNPSMPTQPAPSPEGTQGVWEISFSDPGQCRIDYEGQSPWIRYVTSRDQLPRVEALSGFDDAFFRDNALVVLCVTFHSGSIQPGIGQILCTDNTATVCLVRETQGDQLTADMAAWLLWARVDRDLTCGFRLEDAFLPRDTENY